MLSGFHSVVIDVQDFEEAVVHYILLLGREPSWRGAQTEQGAHCALFVLSNMILEVRDSGNSEQTGEGLHTIRFSAEADPSLAAELSVRGVVAGGWVREVAEGIGGASPRQWSRLSIDPESSRGIDLELICDETGGPVLEVAPTGDGSAAIGGLDHVVVFSADVESTRSFYQQGLGIRLALDKSFEERNVRLLFFRLGGTTIEIGSRIGVEAAPDDADRFGGLAWQVRDVDAIRARLSAERFDVSGVRKGHKAGTRVCTVRDPVHGVPTLLIEPVSR